MSFPSRIICLTEETVETLYLLGRDDLICGISQYVERPQGAKNNHLVVSQFIRSDIEQIVKLGPDLIIGFSDIQKDIAHELIGRGLNVFITNQRSLAEILGQIHLLGKMIGEDAKAARLVSEFAQRLEDYKQKQKGKPRLRVYFEEWDRPRLSGSKWISELIEVCGGENIFAHKVGSLASERMITDEEIVALDPQVIIGCWCGKKVNLDSIAQRPGYQQMTAVKNKALVEVSPEIFLQPGPALFIDGLSQMHEILSKFIGHP